MKTTTRLFACLLLLTLAACASTGGRPNVFTDPKGFLAAYPLGTVTEDQLLEQMGPPDHTSDLAGKRIAVYTVGKDFGLRTYSFILKGGVVMDVMYADSLDHYDAAAMQGKQ